MHNLYTPKCETFHNSLAHGLSSLEVTFSAQIALSWITGLARPPAALSISDPRVPIAVRTRALERAENVRALAQNMAVVQFRTAAFVEIYAHK